MTGPAFPQRYLEAAAFDAFLTTARKNVDFWRAVYRTASIPEDLLARAQRLMIPWRFLVLSEDWCGDAMNTVPVVARLAQSAFRAELRILSRDANPDLMDAHLSSGTRSIPVIMALDDTFVERGWWGPRPSRLQRWVRGEGLYLATEERYPRTRAWYARDRGRSTIEEVLGMLERAERR